MDPATQAVVELWNTAATVDEIWARLGWLNANLAATNGLLAALLLVLRSRKDGEK